jgi:hypothetical protein
VTKKPAKRQKLPDPNGGRSIQEWVAKSPDSKVPEAVQLRVWRRQNGVCPITKRKIGPKDRKRLDHIKPLSMGGQHRESNLQWILDEEAHKPKTAKEAGARAKADRQAKKDAGIQTPTQHPIPARAKEPKPEKAKYADPFPNLPRRVCGRVV